MSVVIKIVSVNVYGESITSIQGDGAVIQDVPDAPVSLVDEVLVTSDVQIGFSWQDGASDGGAPVIDYTVYYD